MFQLNISHLWGNIFTKKYYMLIYYILLSNIKTVSMVEFVIKYQSINY